MLLHRELIVKKKKKREINLKGVRLYGIIFYVLNN